VLRVARGALLLVLVGCSLPEPRGARSETAHYQVRTDGDAALAARAGAAAERAHAALREAYGDSPESAFPLIVYGDRAAFDRELSPELRARACVGECGERFALVFWPDDKDGEDTLAHELVHRFDAALLPGLPFWLDEGLAKALAPKRSEGDWRAALAQLTDDELRARVRSLETLPEGGDYALRCIVAACLVRHGLETAGLASLTQLRSWRPDVEAFLRWLRAPPREPLRGRFAPLWGRSQLGSHSFGAGSERTQRR